LISNIFISVAIIGRTVGVCVTVIGPSPTGYIIGVSSGETTVTLNETLSPFFPYLILFYWEKERYKFPPVNIRQWNEG
jgi:hypothetical protein